ncbi:MAG: FAD-dependent oxidoreductase [Flavisolibacter sp.]
MGAVLSGPFTLLSGKKNQGLPFNSPLHEKGRLSADLVIVGAGLGGCAAALAALRNNLSVILTEETDWIGGQISQQGVPPDEHPWIESHGCTMLYRQFRSQIRQYYRSNYPVTKEASSRLQLNPGDGLVSKLCHEPSVAVAVLAELLAPYQSQGKLNLLLEHKVLRASVSGNQVQELTLLNTRNGIQKSLSAPYFVDATELGDLLPLTGTEYVTGAEASVDTQEIHAPIKGDPQNIQAFTYCFAMDYIAGKNYVIDKPNQYDFWKNYQPQLSPAWPGKLLSLEYSEPVTLQPKKLGFNPSGETKPALNLWNYRRIINKKNFLAGSYPSDITLVNWPQNDYLLGNLIDVPQPEFEHHSAQAKQLSLSLLYWLQTEVLRPDGGLGWPGLRLRKDIMGTEDGLAKFPYIRESRRIKAVFTILEEQVSYPIPSTGGGNTNAKTAVEFFDSVGIGSYRIDLHPTARGNNYIDINAMPFQIPLGALLPIRMENLLPAAKNIGTTHITNGCYRLHPVEWNIGEVVGMLVAYCREKNIRPRLVRESKNLMVGFQNWIQSQGIEIKWP